MKEGKTRVSKEKTHQHQRKRDIPKELTTNEETMHESQKTQTCHGLASDLQTNRSNPQSILRFSKKPIESNCKRPRL